MLEIAQVRDVTVACALKPALRAGVGKQGQLLLRGALKAGGKRAF